MTLPVSEALSLTQDTKLSLFTLDLSRIGVNIQYRFCSDHLTNGTDIVYQSKTFTAYPISASGFERSNRGQSPNPTLSIANTSGIISAMLAQYGDIVGAKLTRQRTYFKYTDLGDVPNSLMEFMPDVFIVARKPLENNVIVTLELQDVASFGNLKLPKRKLQKYTCGFQYRSAECGYTGVNYFDKNDNVTGDPLVDICGKRLSSCKCRFGANAELPFGAFPGIDQ